MADIKLRECVLRYINLGNYTPDDVMSMLVSEHGEESLRTEYHREKACAPFCTVGCVHRVAQVDELRHDPERALATWFAAPGGGQPRPRRLHSGTPRVRGRRAQCDLAHAHSRTACIW